MKRENFKKIIKLRSVWKVDKRCGNYKLPDGQPLSTYLQKLIESQLEIDNLAIDSKGNMNYAHFNNTDKLIELSIKFLFIEEESSILQQQHRIAELVHELLY